jgi:hypothetical protein
MVIAICLMEENNCCISGYWCFRRFRENDLTSQVLQINIILVHVVGILNQRKRFERIGRTEFGVKSATRKIEFRD